MGDCHDHTSILSSHKINDENLDLRWFVRLEIHPGNNNYLSDCMDWNVTVDETDTLPLWFCDDRESIENNARKSARIWQGKYVHPDGSYQNVNYDDDGKVINVRNYRDGNLHGKYEWWVMNSNGSWGISNYRDGKLHGKYKWVNSNGSWGIKNYRDGKLHGKYEWVNSDGSWGIKKYRDGKLKENDINA